MLYSISNTINLNMYKNINTDNIIALFYTFRNELNMLKPFNGFFTIDFFE